MDFAEKRPRRRDYGDRRRKPGQYKNNDSGFANSSTQHNNKSVSAIERGSRYVSATAGNSQESSLQTDMISSSEGMGYKSSSSRSDVVPHASPSTVFSSDHGATSFSPAFNLANPSYVREDEPSVAKQCYSSDSDASQNLSASNQGTYSSTNDISHRDPKMDHNSNMASRSNRNRDDVRSKVVLRNDESFQQASTNNDIDRLPEGPAYSEDTMLSFVNDCSELSLSVSNKERMHPSHSPPTSDLQSGVDFIVTNQHKGSTQVCSAPLNRGIAQSDSSYDSNHTVNHRISSYEANFQQGVFSSMDVRSNSRDAGYFNLPSKADEIVPRSLHSSETSGGLRASESVLNSREVKHAAAYPNELGPGMPSSSIGASSYDDLPIENHSNNSIFPMSSGAHPPEDPLKKLGVSHEAKIEPWSNKIAFQLCPMYGSPEPSTLNRLFVGNLAPSIDDAALYQLFSQFGRVLEARVLRDGGDGRSRGIGVVAMSIVEESRAACRALDGRYVEGCPLRINAVAFKH
ncbi:hypothetical protein KP509_39G052800 [Ceratopteris richardii]|nr:hypothetical protein KP509_39G052800 [Ceratopteris richardii]